MKIFSKKNSLDVKDFKNSYEDGWDGGRCTTPIRHRVTFSLNFEKNNLDILPFVYANVLKISWMLSCVNLSNITKFFINWESKRDFTWDFTIFISTLVKFTTK